MSDIKIGASYPARRNSGIVVQEAKSGALMVYVPYRIISHNVEAVGNHSLCIGQKDGTLSELSLNNLKKVFPAWDTANPFDLQRLEFDPEGTEPEFTLSDYQKEKQVEGQPERYSFRYLNELGRVGLAPADEETEKQVMEKWGEKLKIVLSDEGEGTDLAPVKEEKPANPEKASKVEKPAETPAKKSGFPGKKAAGGQARTSSENEVWDLYVTANPKVDESVLADKFTDAKNEVKPGSADANATEEDATLTPVEWGKVADTLKV